MSITFNKKLLVSILKSCLHIAIYIILGLLLAFFINSTAYAAELDESTMPPVPDPTTLPVHSRADATNFALGSTVIMVHRTIWWLTWNESVKEVKEDTECLN